MGPRPLQAAVYIGEHSEYGKTRLSQELLCLGTQRNPGLGGNGHLHPVVFAVGTVFGLLSRYSVYAIGRDAEGHQETGTIEDRPSS